MNVPQAPQAPVDRGFNSLVSYQSFVLAFVPFIRESVLLSKYFTPTRFAFVVISGVSSFFLATKNIGGTGAAITGAVLGVLFAIVIIVLESLQKDISIRHCIGGIIGLFLGLFTANLIYNAFFTSSWFSYQVSMLIQLIFNLSFGYFGLSIGVRKSDDAPLFFLNRFVKNDGKKEESSIKILDTSVIIDGRIMDIVATGFVEGRIVVPKFVLHELQLLADSKDHTKRSRGKRGLELLEQMKRNKEINVEFSDFDFHETREVDSKLILLAKKQNAKIVTNDYNLNKVASLQGIPVLNINKLVMAIKPIIAVGDDFFIKIERAGKEGKQGVGNLDDGTMVVVDNGIDKIGKEVHVSVTSVLQNAAGRMIFSKEFDETHR